MECKIHEGCPNRDPRAKTYAVCPDCGAVIDEASYACVPGDDCPSRFHVRCPGGGRALNAWNMGRVYCPFCDASIKPIEAGYDEIEWGEDDPLPAFLEEVEKK